MPWSSAEKQREWSKAYYEKNKEVMNAKRKERYRLANPPKPKKPKRTDEERLAYGREYYKNNREKLLAQAKAKREADPSYIEYYREYYKNNKERIEAYKKEYQKTYNEKNRAKINEKARERGRKALEEAPDKVRAARRANKAKQKAKDPQRYNELANKSNRKVQKIMVSELRDSYIRQLLCKHPVVKRLLPEEIPQELVEVKRLEIQIRRLINEKRK
jgi:hypothetical protein